MKAIEIEAPGAPEVMRLAELPDPQPRSDEVVIKVSHAGVNRPDVFQRLGLYPPPPGASPLLGLEVSGEVCALGVGVSRWRIGDKVCALVNGGGYAEKVAVSAGQCLPIPAGLSMAEAAALPETCFTVWSNVFDRAGLKSGETIMIHAGAGGIGTTAIQMSVAMGGRVIVTVSSEEKAELCRSLGAQLVINYNEQDFVEAALAFTESAGVDVTLDCVGGDYLQRNIQMAAVGGRIVNIAFLKGSAAEVDFMPVMLKRLTLTGSTLRPQSEKDKAAIAESLLQHIWPKIEAGFIKPVLAEEFPLGQAAKAHQLMESNRLLGKTVLKVS